MQFKGSVRGPGDKDPGVRVVLEVDEYHLEIRRDSELIGRYYLADVEVTRDIAERFILFLGDDEVEFLADDALQFAYDGVTSMQNGWLTAQKRKRRHRRAAEDSARRKDGEPPLESETMLALPLDVSDSDTIRARRRQADTRPPQPPRRRTHSKQASVREAQKGPAQAKSSPPAERPAPSRSEAPVKPEAPAEVAPSQAESVPVAKAARVRNEEVKPAASRKAAPAPRKSRTSKEPTVSIAARLGGSTEPTSDDFGEGDTSLAARRRKLTTDAAPNEFDELGRVRLPEPVVDGMFARQDVDGGVAGNGSADVAVDPDTEVRFALEGHHPAETSTRLLAKLRRQPRLPDDHVHKFKESGSSVGLVRRVCIECAYVSIGSDDE